MSWARHITLMSERRGVYRVSVGKSEAKRPHVIFSLRWEDYVKMDLQEIGWGHGLN